MSSSINIILCLHNDIKKYNKIIDIICMRSAATSQQTVPTLLLECSTDEMPVDDNVSVTKVVLLPCQSLVSYCSVAAANSEVASSALQAKGDTLNAYKETELRLKQKIKLLQSQRWKLRKKLLNQRTTLNLGLQNNKSVEQMIESITTAAAQFLSPLQLSLLRIQLLASRNKNKCMQWPIEVKTFALQLLHQTPIAYEFLSNALALPSPKTLLEFTNNVGGRL
jgi:hypothetical protein